MDNTIAAVATAYGEGGIGIVKISGEKSKEIVTRIFVPMGGGGGKPIENRRLSYGKIVDPKTKKIIDEVLCVYMKGPASYTGEDVVEINCHGSIVALRKVLELVLENGAILAENGEFTKRAFLNGRMDLSQAEAVMDLIKAKTDKTYQVAVDQMEGLLSTKVREIRNALADLLVQVAVNVDYPDEDIEEMTYENLINSISLIDDDIWNVLRTAHTGRIISEGLAVAIVGKPNVGKSSLMNALLKESRAIVTEIAGTTRDTIEEIITIKGIPIKLTDTAGIRETVDTIEKIGIEKSKEAFNKSDLILFIVDASRGLETEDFEIIGFMENRKAIVLLNKIDLGIEVTAEKIKRLLPKAIVVETSVKNEIGIGKLENEIENLVYGGNVKQGESMLVTNVRHQNLLEHGKKSMEDAKKMAEAREALDFIEVDLKRAYELLGEIIGESVTDDIIDKVFERFCLGK